MILGLAAQGNKCGAFGSTVIGGHDVSLTLGVHNVMCGSWQALWEVFSDCKGYWGPQQSLQVARDQCKQWR